MQRRAVLAAAALAAWPAAAQDAVDVRTRAIARSGERVPVVGLGTWIAFDVPPGDAPALARPYIGELLPQVAGAAERVYCATKVWTPIGAYGPTQMERSLRLWGRPRADLMQVHNLLAADAHLPTLRRWRAEGRLRHLGLTTSHGSKHDALRELLLAERDLDVLQITYNPADRRAEPLMALAAERGMAVIVNRPFDGGHLLRRLQGQALPPLAAELGCSSWAPLLLKWELAHPAVSCVIPATTDPVHMGENLQALRGRLPEPSERAGLTALLERTGV